MRHGAPIAENELPGVVEGSNGDVSRRHADVGSTIDRLERTVASQLFADVRVARPRRGLRRGADFRAGEDRAGPGNSDNSLSGFSA